MYSFSFPFLFNIKVDIFMDESAVYTLKDNPKLTKVLLYFRIVNAPGDPFLFLFTFSPIKAALCFIDNIFNHFVHILLIFQ
ncbi:hypothetical protein VK055_1422 [Klebsiella pneumoniae subsp. pneumoniae]|nr:hypothetical protein VK055_1422 [Klebsiella pneumoniae subsp. pneumoniae]